MSKSEIKKGIGRRLFIFDVELGQVEVIPANATKKQKLAIERRVAKQIEKLQSNKI